MPARGKTFPALSKRTARLALPLVRLTALDAPPAGALLSCQPHWALRTHLLAQLGRPAEARAARDRALGLSEDRAVREFLLTHFG